MSLAKIVPNGLQCYRSQDLDIAGHDDKLPWYVRIGFDHFLRGCLKKEFATLGTSSYHTGQIELEEVRMRATFKVNHSSYTGEEDVMFE